MQFNFFSKKNSFNNVINGSNSHVMNLRQPDIFGNYLVDWTAAIKRKEIKLIGLFSGAGGLDIGFEEVGFKTIAQVEIEQDFCKTLLCNKSNGTYFKHSKIVSDDIRNFKTDKFKDAKFIVGGPPCQSFSAAGRRAKGVKGTKDERGSLFEEYVRVLEEIKPEGFLFENVSGLVGAEKGESLDKITEAFNQAGYSLSYRILDAADYGVPQHRERLILVGLKSDNKFRFPAPFFGPDSKDQYPHFTAQEALVGLENKELESNSLNGRYGHLLEDIPPGLNYSFYTEKLGHPNPVFSWRSKFSDFLYKADPESPIRTLKASGGQYTGPFHWLNRKFTKDELKRLQTFPDSYNIVGSYQTVSKQIGNSVPPQFSRFLALSILDQVFGIKPPFEINYIDESTELSFRKLKRKKSKLYRKRAKERIMLLKPQQKTKIISETFYSGRLKNHELKISSDGPFEFEFRSEKTKWYLNLRESGDKERPLKYSFKVRKGKSVLLSDLEEIHLNSEIDSLISLELLWKGFEHILIKNDLKADLVQLFGYYQYKKKHRIELQIFDENLEGLFFFLKKIIGSPLIGDEVHVSKISEYTGFNVNQVDKSLFKLKECGFEVRNKNTNSEVSENHYLIPYEFPTLNRLSVQRSKKL